MEMTSQAIIGTVKGELENIDTMLEMLVSSISDKHEISDSNVDRIDRMYKKFSRCEELLDQLSEKVG